MASATLSQSWSHGWQCFTKCFSGANDQLKCTRVFLYWWRDTTFPLYFIVQVTSIYVYIYVIIYTYRGWCWCIVVHCLTPFSSPGTQQQSPSRLLWEQRRDLLLTHLEFLRPGLCLATRQCDAEDRSNHAKSSWQWENPGRYGQRHII